MHKRSALSFATGAVLALTLATGCGPEDKDGSASAPKPAEPTASASASPKGPVYEGKPVPGLAGQPVWAHDTSGENRPNCPGAAESTESGTTGAAHCVVGDAVVLTEEVPHRGASDDADTRRFVTRLLDAATGKQRAEFESLLPGPGQSGSGPAPGTAPATLSNDSPSAVGRWKDGSPALLIRSLPVPAGPSAAPGSAGSPGSSPSSGGQDASTAVYTMYSPAGEKLGSSVVQGEAALRRPVVDGLVLQLRAEFGKVTYAPIGGGADVTVAKASTSPEPVGPGFGYATAFKDDYDGKGVYLVVTDRRTGKTAWSTRDMTAPAAVAAANRPGTHATAQLRPLSGGKGILMWNASTSDEAVITVVDLATGKRLTEGPKVMLDITMDDDRTAVSPDGRSAVSQFGEGVVAWDTETGRELWRMKDDKSLRPMAQSPGGVLYAEKDGRQAFNALTGAALSPYEDIPEFTSDGYGVVREEQGLFVFRAAPASSEGKS
ncbi:PQQ-binding-like beta-propeller repeat protein [Streptomyces sp. NPDC002990]